MSRAITAVNRACDVILQNLGQQADVHFHSGTTWTHCGRPHRAASLLIYHLVTEFVIRILSAASLSKVVT